MSKELMLVIATVVFLVLAIYVINEISKLPVSKSSKRVMYFITILVPIVGYLFLVRAKRK
jgi:hypothetical protein